MHNEHRANSNRGNTSIHELYHFKTLFLFRYYAVCMYKNKHILLFWTVTIV